MSGLWRNLLTLLLAWLRRDASREADLMRLGCECGFFITPLDVGLRTLKSDKYLQLVEAAQLDFGLRSGLLGRLREAGAAMVNLEQQVMFLQPVKLFDRVRVKTVISSVDEKFVQFLHAFYVGERHCASVKVKAKFKAGRLTVSARDLIAPEPSKDASQ